MLPNKPAICRSRETLFDVGTHHAANRDHGSTVDVSWFSPTVLGGENHSVVSHPNNEDSTNAFDVPGPSSGTLPAAKIHGGSGLFAGVSSRAQWTPL